MVKPLLSPQATLVADGYRLIVKGTPADIAQLKSLVASLDARLRNLVIDVRTVRRTVMENSRSSARVTIGNESSVRIEASRTSTRARDTNGFQVRTIEGREAFVQVGQQRPEERGVIRIAGGHVVTLGGTAERNARSGIYVTARVRGEQVLLDIAPGQQRFAVTTRDAPFRPMPRSPRDSASGWMSPLSTPSVPGMRAVPPAVRPAQVPKVTSRRSKSRCLTEAACGTRARAAN